MKTATNKQMVKFLLQNAKRESVKKIYFRNKQKIQGEKKILNGSGIRGAVGHVFQK